MKSNSSKTLHQFKTAWPQDKHWPAQAVDLLTYTEKQTYFPSSFAEYDRNSM